MEDNKYLEKDKPEILQHARSMLIEAASIRMKNFNFFLLMIGGLIAIYTSNQQLNNDIKILISGFAFILSVLFFLLDIRGKKILIASRLELFKIEQQYNMFLTKEFKPQKIKIISHTFIYRFIFSLIAIVSIIIVFKTILI